MAACIPTCHVQGWGGDASGQLNGGYGGPNWVNGGWQRYVNGKYAGGAGGNYGGGNYGGSANDGGAGNAAGRLSMY